VYLELPLYLSRGMICDMWNYGI